MQLAGALGKLGTRHAGQPHVEQHHVKRLTGQLTERRESVGGLPDAVAGLLEEGAHRMAKPAIVVDH